MQRRGASGVLPQALLAAAVAALLVYPLLTVVRIATSAGPGAFGRALLAPGAGRAWLNTGWVSAVASLLALILAATAVAALARTRGVVASVLRTGVVLPLLVPPFASAVGWSQAYGPGGTTDALFHLPIRAVIGPVGVIVATAAEVMPIAFLVLAGAAAINGENVSLMAARASGSTRWDAHRRVTAQLMRPPAAAALALTFLAAVNNFTIPAVLGTPAGFETLTSRIYDDLNFATTPTAFVEAQALAAALAVVTLLILLPGGRLLGARSGLPISSAPGGSLRRPGRLAALGLGAYLVVAVVAPLTSLVLTALTRAPGLEPVPTNWSLINFEQSLSSTRFLPALVNSLLLAVAAATVLGLLGLAVATVERRPGGRSIASAVTMGFAVSGSVLAIAYLVAYGRWVGGSLVIILLAYIAKLWALAHRPLSGALRGVPPELTLAARASGAGPRAALRTVLAPILAPALAASWALVFLFAFHEVTMSSLLAGPTSQTLAVLVLNVEQVGDVGGTAALACALTVLVIVPAAGVALLLRNRQGALT